MPPQSEILVDSNAYFRLAQSIHPLLKCEFGKARYCLYVIKELQEEYDRSPRLRNSFHWVNDPEYKENRAGQLIISKKQAKNIEHTYQFVLGFVRSASPGVSRMDVRGLTCANVLNIPIVTDDGDMLVVAKVFSIRTLTTLELLKLMLDCKHIDISKVREIASYWEYLNDKPRLFAQQYKRLFNEAPPR
ncbi:MAG: DNA-binding protein [Deltaproteobacteria bacterium]|nr:DNA-binding protein [Deltaproteobacteria bacterium]